MEDKNFAVQSTAPADEKIIPAEGESELLEIIEEDEAKDKKGFAGKIKGFFGRFKKMSKKKLILFIIIAAVIIAAIIGLVKLFGTDKSQGEALTDYVQLGSITSTVEGSGVTRAKNSATITVTTTGKVMDVYVAEGDYVTAGTPLYIIDSETAKTALDEAKKDVESYTKRIATMQKDLAGLNFPAPYSGKLTAVTRYEKGDTISSGDTLATLVDDNTLRLKQYYSYAYKDSIKAGQAATVSVLALMSQVSATVESVHMVNRISAEGSKLFEVDIIMTNPGTLTEKMAASAVITVGGESVYPYEAGALEYNRSTELKSTVSGTVIKSNMIDYLNVSSGQVLINIDGDDSESELLTLQQSLKTAETALQTAQKNYDNMNAVAPISGTILSVGIAVGDDVAAGTTTISVADTSQMLIDANVDERYISFVEAGMTVNINQWGTEYTGTVESVSLTGKSENGVATFPAVIAVDNADGTMMSGSYVDYTLVASQSDNCLTLPIQCVKYVQLDNGETGTVVFVRSDTAPENSIEVDAAMAGVPEGFYAVPVDVGISDNTSVEILNGVEEGTEVFTQIASSDSMMG